MPIPVTSGSFPNESPKGSILAKENEKPNFLVFYRFFEVFLLEPGIFLLFISPLEAHQFFFTGFEAEIPPWGEL